MNADVSVGVDCDESAVIGGYSCERYALERFAGILRDRNNLSFFFRKVAEV
jgi:hypothetical protein